MKLVRSNVEESEFLEVTPGLDLDDLSGDALVLAKCRDLQLFEAAKMTRMIRVIGPVLGGFSQLRDVAQRAGVPIPEAGLGDTTMEETLQLAEQLGKLELQHAFYGECDGYFKVIGDLNLDFARQAINGTATVVGRVAERFGEDRAYPGVVPEGSSADLIDATAANSNDVVGPGLVLHVLAIFR